MAQGDWWTGDLFTTFLTMLTGVMYYLKVMVWPFALCADHLTFPVSGTFFCPAVILSSAVIITLLALTCILLSKRSLIIPFGVLWFFIALGPVLNIIPLKILVADRFLYLPIIGYCMVLAAFIGKFIRTNRVKYAAYGVIVVFYGMLAISRNNVWANELSLYSDIVSKYPDNVRAGVNLSLAYQRQGMYYEALREAENVLKYDNNNYRARMILSDYYLRKDDPGKAEEVLIPLLTSRPNSGLMQRMAKISLARRQYDKAFKIYDSLRSTDRDNVYADVGVVQILLLTGKKSEAGEYIMNILDGNARKGGNRFLEGSLYLMLGDIYLSSHETKEAEIVWNNMKEDYPDQWVAVFIADMMRNNISEEEYLDVIKTWSPDIRVVGFYFLGSRSEFQGDKKKADKYFKKAAGMKDSSAVFIKRLAENRLDHDRTVMRKK